VGGAGNGTQWVVVIAALVLIDVAGMAEVWRRGSLVGWWLLDLTADALARLRAGDHSIPVGRISTADALVIADEAAAGGAAR
jgi:6-phosphogluconate dehydrogenase (decarboxylating)